MQTVIDPKIEAIFSAIENAIITFQAVESGHSAKFVVAIMFPDGFFFSDIVSVSNGKRGRRNAVSQIITKAAKLNNLLVPFVWRDSDRCSKTCCILSRKLLQAYHNIPIELLEKKGEEEKQEKRAAFLKSTEKGFKNHAKMLLDYGCKVQELHSFINEVLVESVHES